MVTAVYTDGRHVCGMTRDPIHQPRPSYQTGAERWPLPEGFVYEGVAHCPMSHVETLGPNGKALKFLFFFAIRVNYEKIVRMLELLVLKFRPDLSPRIKDIAKKEVHAKLKPVEVCHRSSVTWLHFFDSAGRRILAASTEVPAL